MQTLPLLPTLPVQVEPDPDERDAETRVSAVKALASVATKLFGTSKESQTSGTALPTPEQTAVTGSAALAGAGLVREHVLSALLAAVEDYSTDNRSACSEQRQDLPLHASKLIMSWHA